MPEILIKGKALEDFLAEVADSFRDLRPSTYEKFRNHVEHESKALIKPSGMSRDGHFMNRMYIPAELYHFIAWQARKRFDIDFFSDRKNYDLLCRTWSDLETRRRPTPILDLGATARD